jgi:heat shock transcription factor, other eukaryote
MDCDDWQWANQKPGTMILPSFDPITSSCEVQQVPDFAASGDGGAGTCSFDHDTGVETPFPFCLLGQGFF